ncbi:hypothetical protein AHiyo8_65820 [Arthrobacter sp. Hiyo8]|nr:hypothetical protein AHiyo8_65820 [Arthrobacter sp. Hiyo8]
MSRRPPRMSSRTSLPRAPACSSRRSSASRTPRRPAPTSTTTRPGSLATRKAWQRRLSSETLQRKRRAARTRHHGQRKILPRGGRAYIAGPQWAQYMQQVVGLYDHGDFDAPPQSLIGGSAPQTRSSDQSTGGTGPGQAPQPTAPQPSTARRNPATGMGRADALHSLHSILPGPRRTFRGRCRASGWPRGCRMLP